MTSIPWAIVLANYLDYAITLVVAVLALLAAGLMRRPFGPALGWVVQVLSILSGVFVPMMFLVGAIFAVLYGYCQRLGRRIEREQSARALTEQES